MTYTPDLSILIPARNEPLLTKTVDDILKNIEGNTEIIVGLDEAEGGYELEVHNKLLAKGNTNIMVVRPEEVLGQRKLTNHMAKFSHAKYLMKVDAHCSFGPGFDVKMMADMDDKTILSPQMGVLDPESWAINGKKMVSRYHFGPDFVMQYDQETDEMTPETMCLQGSAWMIERDNYWKWNVCDESLGSWGGQAVELGIAAYLNGGRCMSTKNTYYGHVFRHSDKDFPYQRGDNPGQFATEELKRRYGNDPRIKELASKFGHTW